MEEIIKNPLCFLMNGNKGSITVLTARLASVMQAKHWIVVRMVGATPEYITVAADIAGLVYTGPAVPQETAGLEAVTGSISMLPDAKKVQGFSLNDQVAALFIDGEVEAAAPILETYKMAFHTIFNDSYVDVDYYTMCINNLTDDLFMDMAKRSFRVINYAPWELFRNTCAILIKAANAANMGIEPATIIKFVNELRSGYNRVPYHNWFHALDVTQYVYCVIQNGQLKRYLTDFEIFALLISAVCHDVGHDGRNNTFHRKANTPFAHLSGANLPPLEFHHSHVTTGLIETFMGDMEEELRKKLGNFVIDCILATDMEQHKRFITEFSEIRESFDKENPEHRKLLAQIVIKAADLSNTVRDFEEAARMTANLVDECKEQGREETRRGLPISPMCDPNDNTPICMGQIGFYNFVAGPLMQQLHQFLPELAEHKKQFQDNVASWEEMKKNI